MENIEYMSVPQPPTELDQMLTLCNIFEGISDDEIQSLIRELIFESASIIKEQNKLVLTEMKRANIKSVGGKK